MPRFRARTIFRDQIRSCTQRVGHHQFREYTHPRDQHLSYPKGVIGNSPRSGSVLEVLVTLQCGRCGTKVEIGSLATGGLKPVVVMSRDVVRCVMESSDDCIGPIKIDTSTLGGGQLDVFSVAGKTWCFILLQRGI